MNRSEIAKDMKQFAGAAFITRQGLANYMGKKDPHNVDRYLAGLEAVDGKYYFINDVAQALYERRKM